jgi:hypothetical protein
MSSFYSNLAQEDTKNTKKQMRVKNAIVLKKSPKGPKKDPKSLILKTRL